MESNLTLEEIRNLLRKKEEESGKFRCSYSRGGSKCDSYSEFSYGDKHFCKSHNRTSQAQQAKKSFESKENLEIVKTPSVQTRKAKEPSVKTPSVREDKEISVFETKKEPSVKPNPIKEPSVRTPSVKPEKEVVKAPPQKKKIRINIFGRPMDEETRYVFNSDKKIYGIQNMDGSVAPLKKRDMENITLRGWKYVEPDVKVKKEEYAETEEESIKPKIKSGTLKEVIQKKIAEKQTKPPIRKYQEISDSSEESTESSEEKETRYIESSNSSDDSNSGSESSEDPVIESYYRYKY